MLCLRNQLIPTFYPHFLRTNLCSCNVCIWDRMFSIEYSLLLIYFMQFRTLSSYLCYHRIEITTMLKYYFITVISVSTLS